MDIEYTQNEKCLKAGLAAWVAKDELVWARARPGVSVACFTLSRQAALSAGPAVKRGAS